MILTAVIAKIGRMKTVLIISSYVSASRVGATATAFCMRRLGVEAIVLPTTMFGRHPGWGPPGGLSTAPELLRDMWKGIKAQNINFDGIMTGYMAHPDHVSLSSEIIDHLKSKNPSIKTLIDPVMGDHGKLYVKDSIAKAIKTKLLTRADIITPNIWELGYVMNDTATSVDDIEHILKSYGSIAIVTSVPFKGEDKKDEIGVFFKNKTKSALITHPKFESVPNGGGDSLAGIFFAHYLNGLTPIEALAKATSSIFTIIQAANEKDLGELPLIRMQGALMNAPALKIKTKPYD